MKRVNDIVFFFDGVFSQWHGADMHCDGEQFNCCEQYMMATKALLFGDLETRVKIMEADRPAMQKRFGKEVRGFDAGIWDAHKYKIVWYGNLLKFSQHPDLKKILLETGDDGIAEASVTDKIWGIGLGIDHPDIGDVGKWQGENLLGEVLIDVRSMLRRITV